MAGRVQGLGDYATRQGIMVLVAEDHGHCMAELPVLQLMRQG